MYYGYNYLPKYGFGDWLDKNKWSYAIPVAGQVVGGVHELNKATGMGLSKNAGTIGTAAGLSIGAVLGGPAGAAAGAGIGGQIGGVIQSDYEGDQAALAQSQQMDQAQQQQAYQNRLSQSYQNLGNQNLPQNQNYLGTQGWRSNFLKNGGKLSPESLHGINYNQLFPQKTPTGEEYFITRRTSETMNNPSFQPFGSDFAVFSDPNLAYKYGNMQGLKMNKNNKLTFNTDSTGNQDIFRNATEGKLSYADLGLGKRANGGDLENYSGQTHSGPQGGIPVDAQGTPTITNGEQPTALVEDGEVSFTDPDNGEVYIFSNRLSRK